MAFIKMVPVEEEMARNPELQKSDLEMLRDWCEKQPHLPKISDSVLILFLHSNYYRLEPTKSTIEIFYTLRTHVPELFGNRDSLEAKGLRDSSKVVTHIELPQTTKEGYKIVFAKIIDPVPSHYVFDHCAKLFAMFAELWLHTWGTVPGVIVVIDMDGSSLGHCGRFSPSGLKKLLFYLQEALPVRLKGLHILNTLPFVEVIMSMMKPFMKKELASMFHLHTNLESISKYIPVEALPKEQGGKAGPLMDLHEAALRQVREHRAWFLEDDVSSRVKESLRPGKAKTATNIFGVQGSFKKLDID